MKLTQFFILRPVFTIVANAIFLIIGLIMLQNIELREYPKVELPIFTVSVSYPNASSETIENSVINILEASLSEVEGLDMITSSIENSYCSITMQMKPGSKVEKSMTLIRDAITIVRSNLPTQINEPVIERSVGNNNGLPFMSISFSNNDMSMQDLTHYLNVNVKKKLRSIKGVGKLEIWGPKNVMEILLDLKKMYALNINSSDIIKLFKEHKSSLPAGKFQEKIDINLNVVPQELESFAQLQIKEIEGHPIYLKDIGELTLKSNDEFKVKVNGQPGVMLAITKASDANPLTLSNDIRKELENIQNNFPHGMKAWVAIDQSNFIRGSIGNILSSIIESMLLVLCVIFVFLRNFRSSLIPLLAIPVSLIASIAVLKLFDCSINTITMLAMVLAMGLVVDDAIVILENIHRYIEKGLSPKEAAIKGSSEISFAVVSMTCTLACAYLPIVFINDAIGQIFSEFAILLASSVIISGFVSLSLSPMMCSKLMVAKQTKYFKNFDNIFAMIQLKYANFLRRLFPKRIWVMSIFILVIL